MVKTEYLQEMSIRMAGTIAEYFLQHKVSVELVSNGIDCMTGACERVEAGMSMEHGETIDNADGRYRDTADGRADNVCDYFSLLQRRSAFEA